MATVKLTNLELTNLFKTAKEKAKQELMVAGDGGSPGQPYTPPKEDPKNPWVPAPSRPKPSKLAGGPALPGEPGRKPIPTAPGGRPHLPGEKQTPAPGGGGNPQLPGGMKIADSRTLRDHLKPYTHGTKGYDSQGGSLRGVDDEKRKNLLIQGVGKYQA